MYVVLFRNGNRALFLPAGKGLLDCSPAQRFWLGTPIAESVAELTLGTPMPGIHPTTVLAKLRSTDAAGSTSMAWCARSRRSRRAIMALRVLRICYKRKADRPETRVVKPK